MAEEGVVTVYGTGAITDATQTSFSIKAAMAQLLRGGAIFEVVNLDQAKIAEEAGACAVVVSESGPGGIARLVDPGVVKEIKRRISIPVIARARVGHFVEAQILEAIGVDYIDECELSFADENNFINKHNFRTPFVCGSRDLGEALRRVREGAVMIRIQGELSGSGNVAETVRSVRKLMGAIRVLTNMDDDEVFAFSKKIGAAYDIVAQTKGMARLPVLHFASGGIVTPADAALMMQLGCDAVLVGSKIFCCADPYKRVRAIVQAVRHYNDAQVLAESCSELDEAVSNLRIVEE